MEENIWLAVERLVGQGLVTEAETMLQINKIKYLKDKATGLPLRSDETEEWLAKFITQDAIMLKLKDTVRKLAKHNDPILIQGDTGTGKEILAHALHGKRAGKFLAINCAGLPENLIESELFGHTRGAFTGAMSDKKGMMVEAKDGTLFLDEIGEMPLLMQSKLLRAIQDNEVRPVGSNEHRAINCRFVFATNQNIKEMVVNRTFRIDLYARISVFELHTTRLQFRKNDIPLIFESLGVPKNLLDMFDGKHLDLNFNVRSLQMAARRYKVLGEI